MTARTRILVNVVVSYGRSLFALVCGLLAGRWALQALGSVDFGLYGLIAGLIAFIGFVNWVLGLAVGRFYAFEVGKAQKTESSAEGVRECQKWFSTAVWLHIVVPVCLVALGWPIGEWAVRRVLTIPPDRIGACLWVFRYALLAALIGMMFVPYTAMYSAKQKIAELAIFDMLGSAVKVVALYWMATRAGDWLAGYAVLMAVVTAMPSALIVLRAKQIFPECRILPGEMLSWVRIRELLKYAGCECFGSGAEMLRHSGGAILVNEYLGAGYNASVSFSGSVSNHASALSQSLTTAFYPAITNAYGAGRMEEVRRLALGACRFGALLVILFAVPMVLEAEYVFELWLKTPPPGVAGLCVYMLTATVVERLTSGCGLAINASGKIVRYQLANGLGLMMAFPLMWVFFSMGFGISGFGAATVIAFIFSGIAKLCFARRIAGVGTGDWVLEAALPVFGTMTAAVLFGLCVRSQLQSSFVRVCLVSAASAVPVLFALRKWKKFI